MDRYELVSKWRSEPLPPRGLRFMFKGVNYRIVGVNKAGNKLRAKTDSDEVFLFDAKNFYSKYKVERPDEKPSAN